MRRGRVYYKDLLAGIITETDDEEELALTLTGKKKKLKRKNFELLGKGLGLTEKQINGTFKRFEKNKAIAMNLINRSFLSEDMKVAYKEICEVRYKQIDLFS